VVRIQVLAVAVESNLATKAIVEFLVLVDLVS
jgi:hypothetical protein